MLPYTVARWASSHSTSTMKCIVVPYSGRCGLIWCPCIVPVLSHTTNPGILTAAHPRYVLGQWQRVLMVAALPCPTFNHCGKQASAACH